MSSAFEFGLLLHTRGMLGDKDSPPSFDELWEDAAYAEQMNFDQIWLGDSVCILNRARGDCLTTMAALACKTNRIKIGTVPLIAALRNPVLLAHSLATLDVISKGRISVAVSVAGTAEYNQREFIACGVPFHQSRAPERIARTHAPSLVGEIVRVRRQVLSVQGNRRAPQTDPKAWNSDLDCSGEK
jgi:alkanesulfonate monooxygenase SsuD/methylene tetrahydromethanopterin reductase-like flavin-dependent oxidoreductase (luciferase family)